MSTEIYYFSGTGNSLYVAKELQKLIPGADLIPIAGVLKSDNIKTKGDNVGFVFPCHGLTIPIPVREFLSYRSNSDLLKDLDEILYNRKRAISTSLCNSR